MDKRRRILVVDDDPDDAFFACRALSESCADLEVCVVGNGDEAVAFLAGEGAFAGERQPDHVLLDLKLPLRSGLDVLRWIRAHPVLHALPVSVMSGSELPADVAEARRLGVFDYIRKAVTYAELAERIGDFCRRAGLG